MESLKRERVPQTSETRGGQIEAESAYVCDAFEEERDALLKKRGL